MNIIKAIKINICLLLIAAFTSCSDDFVTEKPSTFADPATFVKDLKSANILLTGAYAATRNIIHSSENGDIAVMWGTMGTDEVVVPGWEGDRKLIYLQQVTPTNVSVSKLWGKLYKAINSVNAVVDRVNALPAGVIKDADQKQIIAEARFLRAALYFRLVCAWENVPLVKNEVVSLTNLDVPQSPATDVYAFIIDDLKFAKENLLAYQGKGRASKGAAQSLLGKVYLQMTGFPLNQVDKYPLAATELKSVIESNVYDLFPDYSYNFDTSHEQGIEHVFSFGFDGPGFGQKSLLGFMYGPNGSVNNGGGWGTCYVNHEFELSYDRTDVRLKQNIAKHNQNDAVFVDLTDKGSWRAWKWHAAKPNNYMNDSPFDNPYIRYSDVLLMYAEAMNGQDLLSQTVLDMTVNKVRTRSGVNTISLGTKSEMANLLIMERRRELCLEGWRRDDLIRFGVYKTVIKAIKQNYWSNSGSPGENYIDHMIRWPIPSAEMELNSALVQNPGY